MKTAFRKSFLRDAKRLLDADLRERVREAIEQVEAALTPAEIGNLKKMAGTDTFFRIRVGGYRLGIQIVGDTVEFVRCLPRRDLYRTFP